ncbi:cyclic nucleotide-binding domain-containing protein [Dyadobacter sp. CY312]|uniref:cyclic nucleotide-binding domain-containing protein n=1 Tax=Dyadobacter sp. CY312 TaxID=2907303 RepID=UPI001F4862F5|nr:cyclic nucleotide-binding domain-containing protein [Dyadobacter sp. CY312]MCE7039359.1 cyclic nucleotide-binding domain-containing protein [Dyadobacter sp. CY312]
MTSIKSGILAKINKQTLLFFLHNFFINVGTTLVYVSANVLLLENHPEYSLPIAYIAAALTVMAAGKIYEYYEHHLVLRRLSLGTMLASLFMVLAVMILLWLGHGIATAIAIMVGYRVIYLLINLEFWGLSALVFDVRQSKRLFSVIGSGDMPAKALGAVLAVLIHSPSVLMILLMISLVFFALAFYTQILTFRHTEIPNPHHARPRQTIFSDSKLVQKYFGGNKLLTALCLGMVAVAAAATWIEYHFFVNVKYKFHSQHDVIVFVGSLLTGTYLVSTFVKVLFSGKTVERFGVKYTLYLLPLTTVLVSLGLLVSSYFRKDEPSLLVYYCAAYLLFEIVRRTIFDPVFLVLFQPLSTKNRLKGHTLAKGFYEPLGMLIAGVLLWLIYTNKLSDISLTFDLSLLFALAALFIFRKAYRAYTLELKSAISKRFIRSGELPAPAEALPIITENLKSERKEEVINAIDWLARNSEPTLRQSMDSLLKNPFVQVRFKALEALSAMEKPELSPFFFLYIESEPDTACQTLAVRISSSKLSDEKLSRYLAHADPDIVKGAIIGCWEAGKSLSLVHGTLRRLLASSNEASQKIALSCLSIIGIETHESAIKQLLSNSSDTVKAQAMEVLISQSPQTLTEDIKPYLSGFLSRSVINALIKSGDAGNYVLNQWLDSDHSGKKINDLVRVAEKNQSAFLQQTLFDLLESIYLNKSSIHLNHINSSLHLSALKSLSNYSLTTEQKQLATNFINVEILKSYRLLGEIETAGDDITWQNALEYELNLTSQRLFYIFMMLYDKESVQNAWKGIRHASKEKRANSLEMIESLLPRTLYPVLHALFEDINIARKREVLRQYIGEENEQTTFVDTILSEQTRGFTVWTIALAIQKLPNGSVLSSSLLNNAVSLIRETARLKSDVSQPTSQFDITPEKDMKHAEAAAQISEMERIIVLKNTQLFSHTPENVLSSIAPIMKEVTYAESQEIFAKGDLGDSMYIIYAGEVGIYDGAKQLALFDKGEIFGELALLDTEPRSATTIAESDVLLFRIDQEDFFELMEERDEILRNVLRILCQRIRVQNEKMRLLSVK